MGRKSRADLQAERESVQAKIVANQAKIVAKTAGVPKGFDSKADKFAGITSVMRANEKSKSPGHPSVSSVYKKNLNNLINSERTRGTAMNISGMNASAAALNKGNAANQGILVDETPNFTDMGMDMGDMSWTAKPNSLQQTNINRIKPVDERELKSNDSGALVSSVVTDASVNKQAITIVQHLTVDESTSSANIHNIYTPISTGGRTSTGGLGYHIADLY